MRHRWICLLTVALLAIPLLACATTVTLQQGAPNPFGSGIYNGAEDTSLIYWNLADPEQNQYASADQSWNYGSDEHLQAGFVDANYYWFRGSALIRFDVSALAGTAVQSARLRTYVGMPTFYEPDYIQNVEVGVKPVPYQDVDWVAGHSNGAAEIGASCAAQKRYGSANWQTGVIPNTTIIDSTEFRVGEYSGVCATISEYPGLVFRQTYVDLPASWVSSWVGTPQPNGGLLLCGEDCNLLSGGSIRIASSDFSRADLRPSLEITFTPEPSSLMALVGGLSCVGLALIRRRRAD